MEAQELFEILGQHFEAHLQGHKPWERFRLELTSPVVATGLPAVVVPCYDNLHGHLRYFRVYTVPTDLEDPTRDGYSGADDCWIVDGTNIWLEDFLGWQELSEYNLLNSLAVDNRVELPDIPKIRQAQAWQIWGGEGTPELYRHFVEDRLLEHEGWRRVDVGSETYAVHPSRHGAEALFAAIAQRDKRFLGCLGGIYLVAGGSFGTNLIGAQGATIKLLKELCGKPLLVVRAEAWEAFCHQTRRLPCWFEPLSQDGVLPWVRLVRRMSSGPYNPNHYMWGCRRKKTEMCNKCQLIGGKSLDFC